MGRSFFSRSSVPRQREQRLGHDSIALLEANIPRLVFFFFFCFVPAVVIVGAAFRYVYVACQVFSGVPIVVRKLKAMRYLIENCALEGNHS